MANEGRKNIDGVTRPGIAMPNSSSKPIVVSDKPEVKDPMVNDPNDLGVYSSELENNSEQQIATQQPSENQARQSQSTKQKTVTKTVVKEVKTDPKDKGKKEKLQKASPEPENITSNNITKVEVPSKRRRIWPVVVLLISLFSLIGVALAADAELIKLPFNLPFDFIKKSQPAEGKSDINETQSSESAQNTGTANSDQYIVPEGYIVYENKELGFKFAYPKEWGVVKEGDKEELLLSGHTEQYTNKSEQINGQLDIAARQTKDYSTVLEKGGPIIKLDSGKWIVSDPQTNVSPDNVKYRVGDEIKVPIAFKNDKLVVYDFSSGEEGCRNTRWVFEAKANIVEISTPSLCGEDFTPASQANIDAKNATNSAIIKTIVVN